MSVKTVRWRDSICLPHNARLVSNAKFSIVMNGGEAQGTDDGSCLNLCLHWYLYLYLTGSFGLWVSMNGLHGRVQDYASLSLLLLLGIAMMIGDDENPTKLLLFRQTLVADGCRMMMMGGDDDDEVEQ
jgi:hypothetical protein